MEYDKIKAFGDAIESGILILPDEEKNLHVVIKGSEAEIKHFLAVLIADISISEDITVTSIIVPTWEEAQKIKRYSKNKFTDL